jgi:hypothetical protein
MPRSGVKKPAEELPQTGDGSPAGVCGLGQGLCYADDDHLCSPPSERPVIGCLRL